MMDSTTFSGAGWLLYAQFYNASGQVVSSVGAVGSSDPSSISTAWSQKSGQITVPANAATMVVYPHFYLSSGWVAFDDLSVIKVGTVDNLVPNPDFLKITYKQDLSNEIGVDANKTYSISALVRANGSNATGDWAVRVHFYDSAHAPLPSDGFVDIHSAADVTVTPTGQSIGGQFTTPTNAAYMKISLSSALSAGSLTIENVSLSLAPNVTKYYYAGTTRIAMRVNGTLTYLLSDHLGSTSLVVKDSITGTGVPESDVISELRYKAWGEVRYTFGTTPTDYTYTGQYSDSYINLLWYGSRHYDPYLNQFTQPDTIVPDLYNSQDWNRYSYARNNPVRYTDPTGHRIVDGCSELAGGCNITQKIIDDDKRKENQFRQRTEYLQCWAGDANHCSGLDKAIIALDNFDFGDGTIQFGFGINGFAKGLGIRGDLGVAMDFKGNIALIATGGGGGYIGMGGGVGGYLTVTNAPSVDYLQGANVEYGGQIGEGETVAAEIVQFKGADRERYGGLSIADNAEFEETWGLPIEGHASVTTSSILYKINWPDLIVNIFRP